MPIGILRDELIDTFGDKRNWNDFAEFTLEEIVNIVESVTDKYMD